MGSWSVYCEISKIAITAGDECVLLPIKKNKKYEYKKNIPATLPIYGTYDDYGGMEDIEINSNTKLIESHFGISIDEFVCLFVDGELTFNREEASAVKKTMSNYNELKDWNFMWINREVYNFMSSQCPGFGADIRMGNREILTLLGFKFIEKIDGTRFNLKYTYDTKEFYSDGTWLQTIDDESIFHVEGLSEYITLTDHMKDIGSKSMWQVWNHLSQVDAKKILLATLGYKTCLIYTGSMNKRMLEMGIITQEVYDAMPDEEEDVATLLDNYTKDYKIHGNELSKLKSFNHNLYCMSSSYVPYTLYITPQCGEHNDHQIFLDEFARINKTKTYEEE